MEQFRSSSWKIESLSPFETSIPKLSNCHTCSPWTSSERLMYVEFTSCVQGVIKRRTLGLSHSREHKFKRSFQDTLNPPAMEMTNRAYRTFYPPLPQFVYERRTHLSTQVDFNYSLLENTRNVLTKILLFRKTWLRSSDNSKFF